MKLKTFLARIGQCLYCLEEGQILSDDDACPKCEYERREVEDWK